MRSSKLVIGVDLGMTCTGVAYSYRRDMAAKVLDEDWPGAEGEIHRKVPTILVYSKHPPKKSRSLSRTPHSRSQSRPQVSDSALTSWGFLALEGEERNSPEKVTREWFKLELDESFLQGARNHEDVCAWYRDFLTKLYNQIQTYFEAKKPDLWKGDVRFAFSVPTTWKEAKTINRFKVLIAEAGFGQEPGHTTRVTMTEAQAAAVATAEEKDHLLKRDQIILVCDAGGGTTDISLLQIELSSNESLCLKSLDGVIGITAGSTFIDKSFRGEVRETLEKLNEKYASADQESLIEDVDSTARSMAGHRDFDRHKRNLSPETLDLNVQFKIKIPGVSDGFNDDDLGIKAGNLLFKPKQMATFFDLQIDQIRKAINKQIENMDGPLKMRSQRIDYLILSGGLGSSKYVKDKLEKEYTGRTRRGGQHTEHMQVLQAAEPQTVVCRGLVIDENALLHRQEKPLSSWISRRSYGVVGVKIFDPSKHQHDDIDTELSKQTGVKKAKEQIHWVVDKGQTLNVDSNMSYQARRTFSPETEESRKEWTSRMVVSDCNLEDRPSRRSDPRCKAFCNLKSDFSRINPANFDQKRRRFYEKGKTHLVANYEIKVIVGPADIKFELWYDGKKMSKEGDIDIEYEDTFDELLEPSHRLQGLLRRNTPTLGMKKRK